MTRDEAKQLLGGYATGSLTESERKALFEAALDDQELFEELAGEQDLKEILALPGAKQRLAAAVTTAGATTTMSAPEEKKKRAWWLFALAGVASVGLLMWITTSKKTEAPVEVASQTVAQTDVPLPEPPITSPALENAVREARKEQADAEGTADNDAFTRKAPGKSSAASEARKASAKGAAKTERAEVGQQGRTLTAPQAATAPPPPPAAQPNSAIGGFAAGPGPGAAATDAAVTERQLAQNGAATAAKGKALAAAARPDSPPVRAGSLTYVLTGRGSLKVTPAVSGSLEVTAADRHIIGWDPVVADSTVEMPVPSGVDSLTLRFAVPGQQQQVVEIPIRR